MVGGASWGHEPARPAPVPLEDLAHRPIAAAPPSPNSTSTAGLAGFDACLAAGTGPLGRTLVELLEPLLGQVGPLETPGGALRLVEVTSSPAVVIDAANPRVRLAGPIAEAVRPSFPW